MEVETLPLDSVYVDPANVRRHNERNLEAIKSSLRRFGQVRPILVASDGRIIAGNGTYSAAKLLGWNEIRVVRTSMSDGDATAYAIADNRTAELAEWDEPALLAQLQSFESDVLADLAFDDTDLKVLEAASNHDGRPEPFESELTDDDNPEAEFLAPFPWFGGKSRIARAVWKRFGDVKMFVEPFFGSGACLLNRPLPFDGVETVNDLDGLVSNFWRAVAKDPDGVAAYADWPVLENDLHARHLWLIAQKETLQEKLEGDPEFFDAKIAGWWVWGMACWIGGEFCSSNGPWGIQEVDGVRKLVHLGGAGQGVNRRLVHLGAGRGVNRRLVHLGGGRGVNRNRVHLGNAEEDAKPGRGEQGLLAWMQALSERFRRVRVCCGDWTRVCGGKSGDALNHFFFPGTPCAVFLDPPYADTANRDASIYRVDSSSVAHDVREWCIAHGDDERLRIALCGYEGEHVMPSNWDCVKWKASGGMSNLGNGRGKENAYKERVWFSPHCLKPERAVNR